MNADLQYPQDCRPRHQPQPSLADLRSNPLLIQQAANLMASYDQQANAALIGGKLRGKSGRVATTEHPHPCPEMRWPNESYVCKNSRTPPKFDELSLAQFVTGQLTNIMEIQDMTLLRQMMLQLLLFTRDAVNLPRDDIRGAYWISMSEIE